MHNVQTVSPAMDIQVHPTCTSQHTPTYTHAQAHTHAHAHTHAQAYTRAAQLAYNLERLLYFQVGQDQGQG